MYYFIIIYFYPPARNLLNVAKILKFKTVAAET